MSRLFGLLVVAIGAALCLIGVRGLVRGSASADWPTAKGQVVSASVERHRARDSDGHWRTTYRPDIRYQYAVGETAYRGARVSYGDVRSSSATFAEQVVRRYPVGEPVTVFYMPEQPGESLLEPGVKAEAWLLPGVGAVFAGVGVLIILLLPHALKSSAKTETTGR